MAANEELLLQVINDGLGLSVDEINAAIKALGPAASKETVIAYCFEAKLMQGDSKPQTNQSGNSSSKSKQNNNKNNNKVDSISKGISGIDIASGGQTLQQTTIDPSKEHISGKDGAQSVKQMLLDQAKQRQKEKAELEKKNKELLQKEMEEQKKKEYEQREHEKKVETQKMKMREKRQRDMAKQRGNKKKNHSQFLNKQAKYINEAQQAEDEMKKIENDRAEKEEKINTPEQAVNAMVKEYGKEEAGQKLMYIRRLLLKILNGPKDLNNALNRQLRTFDYKDQTVLVNIVTPFGPKVFLETIGFEERKLVKNKNDPVFREEQTFLILPNKKFDIKKIENAFNVLNKHLEITSLAIHSTIYTECYKKENISANSLFYGTFLIYNTICNTMRDVNAENARSVDKLAFPNSCLESKTFSELIRTLGFKEHALVTGSKYKLHYAIENGTWTMKPFTDKGERMLLVNGERLYDVLVLLLPHTTLGGAVFELIQNNINNNNKEKIYKFLRTTLTFVTKRMNESLDHKKNHIDLNKVKEKCPNMLDKNGKENGIRDLLLLLDFEEPDELGLMFSVNTSKQGIGMAQTIRKHRIFEFAVNYYCSM